MPELPEVEITARLIGAARRRRARRVDARAGRQRAARRSTRRCTRSTARRSPASRRRGKQLVVESDAGLVLLIHLMSAGRLQLFDRRAGLRDRTSRVLLRLEDGRELRLREFGTKQAAWAKLLRAGELEADEAIATLGPEAWPDPPPFAAAARRSRARCTRCCATSA